MCSKLNDGVAVVAGALTGINAETAERERAPSTSVQLSSRVQATGQALARYGLALVIGWIGCMKFTAYEANGIHRYTAHSPLLNWIAEPMGIRGFSVLLGFVEITVAILIALRRYAPRASALGSLLAIGMFFTTLSFLFTTPGVWEPTAGGFPALSGFPGQFLLKDVALLGISLWSFGEAWSASERSDPARESAGPIKPQ